MTEGISQSRMLVYIMAACLLPILLVAYQYRSTNTQLERLTSRIETIQQQAFLLEQKLTPNRAVQAAFRDADRFYLDKYVENIQLLESEIAMLEKIVKDPIVPPDPQLVSRLDALRKNTIQFSEGTVESYPFFKEVPDSLARAVEVDDGDIQEIISRIEGISIGKYEPGPNRPQMIITDFKLERKTGQRQSLLYSLNIKMIKREFL
ncbi:MAG: hypothetical protein Q8K75_11085 [Chlamydiales bacterium]|nr:hypothetical protein [Chlamydiales bacterium]